MRAVIATFIAVFLASIPSISTSSDLSPEVKQSIQIECIAKGMYHEARGESVEGIKAVGYVILNRTERPKKFSNTPCGVLYQGSEFQNIRKMKVTDWKTYNRVKYIAEQVYSDPDGDNTKSALYFHHVKIRPKWTRSMERTVVYGNHVFLKPRNVT